MLTCLRKSMAYLHKFQPFVSERAVKMQKKSQQTPTQLDPMIETHSMTIDEALDYLGGYRHFQWMMDACFCIMSAPRVFQVLLMTFAAKQPLWKCAENSTVCTHNYTSPSIDVSHCNMSRTDWTYVEPPNHSIVSQFDLQCGNEWQLHLLTSVIFLGWALGAVVLGFVADNYGRKIVIYPSQAAIIVVGFLCSFFPNIPLLIFARFVIGFFIPGAMIQSFVLMSEYVGSKQRPLAGILIFVSFSVSMCILPLKAYLVPNWKHLMVMCTIPYLLTLMTYFFVPESVRWMRLRRGKSELMETFRRISYWNKIEMPSDMTIVPPPLDYTKNSSTNLKSIFETRKIAIITLINGYAWLVNGMVYYGLVMAAGDLGGSLYINFFLLSLVGIPADLLAIDLCNRLGRKRTVMWSLLLASLFCIGVAFLPVETKIGKLARITFGMIGKLSVGISFSGIYVWSLEVYPTTMRCNAFGFLQVTSRIGAASAPWVAHGLQHVSRASPYIVMGASSLIATILLVFIPETKGLATLETNEDILVIEEQKHRLTYTDSMKSATHQI